MRSSYREEDVILLLKDITGLVEPQPTKDRERQIQAGRHYSEMLPIEYVPTDRYMEIYKETLDIFSGTVAQAVGRLADKVMVRSCTGIPCQGGYTSRHPGKAVYKVQVWRGYPALFHINYKGAGNRP